MTNESIFYIIGLILGGILGYAIRAYTASTTAVKVIIWRPEEEGEDNEQN